MDKAMRVSFLLSLAGHLLLLKMPFGVKSNSQITEEKFEDVEKIYIKIVKPSLLPKIDIMGQKKRLPDSKLPACQAPAYSPNKKTGGRQIANYKSKERINDKQVVMNDTQVIDSSREAMLRYQDMVKQRIEEVRRYPFWAKKQGIEGIVYINFTILSNGLSRDIKIIRSSNSKILDEEAIATIKKANPFPPIPKEINTSLVQMGVSIVFSLK